MMLTIELIALTVLALGGLTGLLATVLIRFVHPE